MKGITRDLDGRMIDLLRIWRDYRGINSRGLSPKGLLPDELQAAAARVRELSRGLTRERDLAGERYFSDPGILGAYLLYYWPVSYAQGRILLRETAGNLHSALDLGAGPGPLSLALLDHGVSRVMALDRSEAGLLLARRAAEASGRRIHTAVWDALAGDPLPAGPFDIVTAGHLLNELWTDRPDRVERRFGLVEKIAAGLSPEGKILIIEPALTAVAQDLLRLRDRLAAAGWRVESPCIFRGPCPALPDGVCHAEYDWTPPRLVRDIARRSRVSSRENLKTAYLVVSPPGRETESGREASGDAYRVVSEGMLSKSGRVRYFVCGPGGRFTLSAKRDGIPAGIRPFLSLRRGDLVRFSGTDKRENGLGLAADSFFEVTRRRPDLR